MSEKLKKTSNDRLQSFEVKTHGQVDTPHSPPHNLHAITRRRIDQK